MKEKKRRRNTTKAARGRPFKKGPDPRRNTTGQRNAAAVAFATSLRSLLVAEGEKLRPGRDSEGKQRTIKKVEWLAQTVWLLALNGHSWAVQFIAERVEGKVTLPLEFQGDTTINVMTAVPRPEGKKKPASSKGKTVKELTDAELEAEIRKEKKNEKT